MRIPKPESLADHSVDLARIVASKSWLPNLATVQKLPKAVFPTMRRKSKHPIFSPILKEDQTVGMYDDNATPEWALFWSHRLEGTRPKGWTVAHVWPTSEDIDSYTHVANLAMVPEALSSLTDKNGPLTDYLRWHSWSVYAWKPAGASQPIKPEGFDKIEWRYFPSIENPNEAIRLRFQNLNNQRTRILKDFPAV